jgi:hypothetical protein
MRELKSGEKLRAMLARCLSRSPQRLEREPLGYSRSPRSAINASNSPAPLLAT